MNLNEEFRTNNEDYFKEIHFFLNKILDYKHPIVIIPHESTDLDAYASAYLTKEILTTLKKGDFYIVMPEPSQELSYFINEFSLQDFMDDFHEALNLTNRKFSIIIVDIADPRRFINPKIIEFISKAEEIFVIDHHASSSARIKNSLSLPLSSTSEILLLIAEKYDILESLCDDRKLVNAVIGGILSDTAFLLHANQTTFYFLSKLTKFGDYKRVYSVLKGGKKDISERIARIKGAQRAEMFRYDDFIVLVTHVGSYEASVASALVSLGANVGIAISKKKEKKQVIYRVSGRSTGRLNLGQIFTDLANEFSGTGGGHKSAAGLKIHGDMVQSEELLTKKIVESIINEIKAIT
ncbi:MAG: DHH family phosphoesterase [Candidatus Njordarchaeales archaeon]